MVGGMGGLHGWISRGGGVGGVHHCCGQVFRATVEPLMLLFVLAAAALAFRGVNEELLMELVLACRVLLLQALLLLLLMLLGHQVAGVHDLGAGDHALNRQLF